MPPTTPNKETLEKAADLLQRAHDWIEQNGFDINDYGSYTLADVVEAPEEFGTLSMCYIGNLRFQAGVDPAPATAPADDDGPELGLALAKLDEIARSRIKRCSPEVWAEAHETHSSYLRKLEEEDVETGSFIEALGFLVAARARQKFPFGDYAVSRTETCEQRERYQKNYALRIIRKALTEIYS